MSQNIQVSIQACDSCGKKIPSTAKVCRYCGTNIIQLPNEEDDVKLVSWKVNVGTSEVPTSSSRTPQIKNEEIRTKNSKAQRKEVLVYKEKQRKADKAKKAAEQKGQSSYSIESKKASDLEKRVVEIFIWDPDMSPLKFQAAPIEIKLNSREMIDINEFSDWIKNRCEHFPQWRGRRNKDTFYIDTSREACVGKSISGNVHITDTQSLRLNEKVISLSLLLEEIDAKTKMAFVIPVIRKLPPSLAGKRNESGLKVPKRKLKQSKSASDLQLQSEPELSSSPDAKPTLKKQKSNIETKQEKEKVIKSEKSIKSEKAAGLHPVARSNSDFLNRILKYAPNDVLKKPKDEPSTPTPKPMKSHLQRDSSPEYDDDSFTGFVDDEKEEVKKTVKNEKEKQRVSNRSGKGIHSKRLGDISDNENREK